VAVDQAGTYRLAFHRHHPGSAEICDTIDEGVKVLEKPAPATQRRHRPARGHHVSQGTAVAHGLCDRAGRRGAVTLLKMSAEVKPAAAGHVQIVARSQEES
jgi:hypothetical protein